MSDQTTILAVDDSREALAMLSATLTGEGYRVRAADSGELALASAGARPPDLILLDVRMEGLDGLEVCRRLKADERTCSIPVILISAFAQADEWIAGLQMGAADYVNKPFRTEELLTRVKAQLAIRQAELSLSHQAESLRESEERYRMLFNHSPDGIVIATPDWHYTDVNTSVCQMLGYTREELIGKHASEVVVPEDAPRITGGLYDEARTQARHQSEWTFRRKDGSTFVAEVIAATMPDGHPMAVMRDVTERKRAEEELRRSAERLELAQDAGGVGVWDWDVVSGQIEWTAKMFGLFGLDATKDTASFESWRRVLHPEDLARAEARIMRALDEHTVLENEYRVVMPNGEVRWINATGKGIYSDSGDSLRMIGTCTDITERKQAEEKLQEREEKYRLLFENVMNGFALHEIVLNDEGRPIDYIFLEVNHAFEQLTGLRRENIIGRKVTEVLPGIETDPADWIGKYGEVTLTGKAIRCEQYAQPLDRWYSVLAFRVREGQFAVIFEDVTERKRAEEKQRAALAEVMRLREALDEVSSHIYIKDLQSRYMYANQSTLKLFGCSAEQLVGKGDECFFPPDTVRQLREVDLRVFSGTRNEQEINVSGSGPAVSNRVYWEVKTPLYADPERQTVLGLLGISTDITERKRAEEALEESSERLRREKEFTETLIDSSPDTIFVFDPATGKAVVWNEAFRQVSGYTDEEIAGLKAPDSYYSTEDLQRAEETIKRVFEDGRGTVQLTLLTKQGQAVPFEYNVSVLPGEGSATPVFISIGRDLTEHKQAEEALRLTRFTLEHVSDALFWITPDARLVDVNEAACRSLGYARDELLRLTVPDVDIQHSAAVWPAHFEELRRRGSLTFESVQRAKDGRLIPVEIVANYVQFGDKERNCAFVRDITKRKQAEEERRRIEEDRQRFFLLAESSSEFIGMCDLDLQPVYVNPAGRRMVGLPDMAAACRVKVPDYFYPEDQAFIANEFFPRVLREGHGDVEIRLRHFQTGEPLWFYYYLFSVHDAGGNAIGWATVSHDITERRRADEEKQMLQAQLTQALKMEAVGRLAGGVAHDFNNMLGVILGHTGMALEMAAPTDPLRGNLAAIEKAALRCADLTRQILAFARKQTVAPRAIDLNSTVEAMLKMLRRLIGEDIAMAWIPGEELWPVQVDPAQIDQIMANLCVNARDAIAGVGKITIETGNVVFDEAYCAAHAGSVPGEYVLLAVSDDGCGMDAETLSHVFEPFFTTKTLGQGTGLGLATVYGAVKQNQGFINVYSEPGQGTTFKIYLRRHAAQPEPAAEEGQSREAVGGGETILLVEDEPDILQTTTALVERLGYRVLAASTPGAALRLAREHTGRIDLLMTDVVMPEMNGRDLAKSIQSLYPDIGRLFMSGYTANVIAHHGVLDPGVHFLQKPFSMQDLGAKIREALRNG